MRGPAPSMGRITGSASIETLVTVMVVMVVVMVLMMVVVMVMMVMVAIFRDPSVCIDDDDNDDDYDGSSHSFDSLWWPSLNVNG